MIYYFWEAYRAFTIFKQTSLFRFQLFQQISIQRNCYRFFHTRYKSRKICIKPLMKFKFYLKDLLRKYETNAKKELPKLMNFHTRYIKSCCLYYHESWRVRFWSAMHCRMESSFVMPKLYQHIVSGRICYTLKNSKTTILAHLQTLWLCEKCGWFQKRFADCLIILF